MILFDVLYFIIGCYGVSTIIVQSKIFKPIRETLTKKLNYLGKLINCMMCTGFWVGLLFSIGLGFSPSKIAYIEYVNNYTPDTIRYFIFTIFDAAFISSVIYHIYLLELLIESKLPNEQ